MDKAITNAEDMAQITRLFIDIAGELTQRKVEDLNDALREYPSIWMIQVLNQARDKKRGWRWCEQELEKRHTSEDPDKYTQGQYGDIVIRTPEDLQRVMAMRKARNA